MKLIELNKTYIIRTQVEQNAVNPKENESHGKGLLKCVNEFAKKRLL